VTGDGAVPVRLAPDRVVWLFGDTFVGARNADGSLAPGWVLVHNSIVEQRSACFRPLVGASGGAPVSFVATPGVDDWLWPTGGFVRGSEIVVTLLHMHTAPGTTGFAFSVTGAAVATLRRGDLTVTAVADVPAMTITTATGPVTLGETLLTDRRHVYAYATRKPTTVTGSTKDGPGVEHFVARSDRATAPLGPWSVWDGRRWTADTARLAPMEITGVAPVTALAVTAGSRGSTGFRAVGLSSLDPGPVRRWTAPTPAGPWRRASPAGRASAPDGGLVYGARLVSLPGAGEVLEHSQNDVALDAVVGDPSRYGVRFAKPTPYDHRP
jgi:hypothetical protein